MSYWKVGLKVNKFLSSMLCAVQNIRAMSQLGAIPYQWQQIDARAHTLPSSRLDLS